MTIKELRKASGMTQQAFADYFGTPKRNVENWEYGKSVCAEYIINLMYYKLKNDGILENNAKKAEA